MNHAPFTSTVAPEEAGCRLDAYLHAKYPGYSRTYFQSLIEKEQVRINAQKVKKSAKVEKGDLIDGLFAPTDHTRLTAQQIPLDILYEDDYLLAINKPAGMVVHPAAGNWSNTFVNALLFYCQELEDSDSLRPGIVHRLDKETSGVLLAAKEPKVKELLMHSFANRQITKHYCAITVGSPGKKEINAPIGRHPIRRKEMTVREGGKEAHTSCETINHNGRLALVKLIPHTGRTHQLRVHLQSIGCPILGDRVYGSASANARFQTTRQLLHAHILRFYHPITKEEIELKAPFPPDMLKFMRELV